jgi:NADPH-dependent 2,4-dienoyl-CoA reductase/sulfur reductase-like enzyme
MKPWPPEKRSAVKRKIDKEAARAAARLGARSVLIVAFFADGEYLHMQDGGTAPMAAAELYKKLATSTTILEESGGNDVALS